MKSWKDSVIKVSHPSEVPNEVHYQFLIYKTSSVYIPGDERSKTCPGHGYPEHYETYNTMEHYITGNRDAALEFIKDLDNKKDAVYLFVEVSKKLTIQKTVNFDIR